MTGHVVVEAQGLRCPMPVIALARRARELPGGTVVDVLTTDPAARLDIPAWARLRGHETVGVTHEDDALWRVTVRLRPAPR